MTLRTSRDLFKIDAPLYIYEMRYSFPLNEYVRDVFSYYQLNLGQLHPNEWTLMSILLTYSMVGLRIMIIVVKL